MKKLIIFLMILSLAQFVSAKEDWEKKDKGWKITSTVEKVRHVTKQHLLAEKALLERELEDIQKVIDRIEDDLDKIEELEE